VKQTIQTIQKGQNKMITKKQIRECAAKIFKPEMFKKSKEDSMQLGLDLCDFADLVAAECKKTYGQDADDAELQLVVCEFVHDKRDKLENENDEYFKLN
jgi:DNA helicase IV